MKARNTAAEEEVKSNTAYPKYREQLVKFSIRRASNKYRRILVDVPHFTVLSILAMYPSKPDIRMRRRGKLAFDGTFWYSEIDS
jgi:hypothetical protein